MADLKLRVLAETDDAAKQINTFAKNATNQFKTFTNTVTGQVVKLDDAITLTANQLKKFKTALAGTTDIGQIEFLNKNIAVLEDRLKSLQTPASQFNKNAAALESALLPLTKDFNKLGISTKLVADQINRANGPFKQFQVTTDQLAKSSLVLQRNGQAVAVGLDKLAPATGRANTALVNFGRVVQDAPFGIIGIANNIDPLLQSFSALKAQAGSTGGALRAFGGALLGPAGIAVAVSAVTSALIAFGPEIAGFLKGQNAISEETKKLNAEIGEETAKLKVLGAVLSSDTATRAQKAGAIKKLRDEYGPYLQNLTDEQILNSKGVAAIQAGTIAILNRAKARAAEGKIAANAAKQLELEARLLNIAGQIRQANKEYELLANTTNAATLASERYSRQLATAKIRQEAATQAFKDAENEYRSLTDQNNKLAESAATFSAVDLVDELDKTKTSAKGAGDAAAAAAAELAAAWDRAVGPIVEVDRAFLGLVGTAGIFRQEFDKFNADKYESELQKARDAINTFLNAGQGFEGRLPELGQQPVTLKRKANLELEYDEAVAAAKLRESIQKTLDEAAQGLVIDGITGIAETLGAALTGGDIAAGLNAFAQTLGNAVQGIGKRIIVLSALFQKLQGLLSAGLLAGPAGIAIGLGLVAAGAALKSLAAGPRLATGGVVFGPTQALIGEGGPEAVIPLSQLQRLVGGGQPAQAGPLLAIARGNDLYFSNRRAADSYSRLYG